MLRPLLSSRVRLSTLVYRVDERPLVRSIKLNGIKELKRSKVRGALTMRTPSILHPQALQESIAAIRQTYIDEGFYAVGRHNAC